MNTEAPMAFRECVRRWGRPDGWREHSLIAPVRLSVLLCSEPSYPYWFNCGINLPGHHHVWLKWTEHDDLIVVDAIDDATDWCMMHPTLHAPTALEQRLMDVPVDDRANLAVDLYVLRRLVGYVNTEDQC